jgi:hypothetical protein
MRRDHGAKCTCPAARSCVAGFDPAYGCESTVVASIAKTQALHPGGLNCHFLASLDADLPRVIAVWDGLPAAIRKAAMALIESQCLHR